LDASAYQEYAQRLNLDTEALSECLESERYSDEIVADAQYASDMGVTGTPTFFINGIPLVGAQPLSAFVQIIESELAD
jgi:predicted DsbA family dithiol-disulfide isomerase